MKNKLFTGLLITLSIPASHAVDIVGAKLDIGTFNTTVSKSGAVGSYNEVAEYGFATGYNNTAGEYSFAGGYEVSITSTGGGVIGFGEGLTVNNAFDSAIFGINSDIYGAGSLEGGALMAGFGNRISRASGQTGTANIVLGQNNVIDTTLPLSTAGTTAAVLLGMDNTSNQSESWLLGRGNKGQFQTVTLGTYASEVNNASLIVGTGTGVGGTPRANGLVVLKNGTVQIPSGNLLLGSESAITSGYLTTNGYFKKSSGAGSGSVITLGSSSTTIGAGSIAIGNDSSAASDSSIAIGSGSLARGTYNSLALMGGTTGVGEAGRESAAIGPRAVTSGPAAMAMGYEAHASTYASAFGISTNASGWSSSAIGNGSVASGDMSVSIGYLNVASANNSVAIGTGAQAGNVSSVALGSFSTSNGYESVTLGNHSSTTGNYSAALGGYVSSVSLGSVALGYMNDPRSGSATTWVPTDSALELGNGVDGTHRSNALVVLKNGRATLTNKYWNSSTPTAVPTTPAGNSDGQALVVEGHTVLKGNTRLAGKVTLEEAQGDISMGIYE